MLVHQRVEFIEPWSQTWETNNKKRTASYCVILWREQEWETQTVAKKRSRSRAKICSLAVLRKHCSTCQSRLTIFIIRNVPYRRPNRLSNNMCRMPSCIVLPVPMGVQTRKTQSSLIVWIIFSIIFCMLSPQSWRKHLAPQATARGGHLRKHSPKSEPSRSGRG